MVFDHEIVVHDNLPSSKHYINGWLRIIVAFKSHMQVYRLDRVELFIYLFIFLKSFYLQCTWVCIASIINDSRSGMNDVTVRTAPTNL